MGKIFMDYFTNFADRDYKQMYYRTQWDKGDQETDVEAIAREEAELEKGMAEYKAVHPNSNDRDIVEEMMAENGEN